MTALKRNIFLEMLLAGAVICLIFGISLPVVEFTWLWLWRDSHSILSVLKNLSNDGEYFLAGILAVFSLVFPALKLVYLGWVYLRGVFGFPARKLALKFLSVLGKLSMLDVLVLALVVFYAKQTGLADAIALPGIYFFTASVLLTMWASVVMEQFIARFDRPDPTPQRTEDQR